MTTPLQPPAKKNPQKRTVSPTLPPMARSRAALGLTAAAAEGRFALQCLHGLDRLPPTGAVLMAAPLKIRKGTGSPLRVLAMIEKDTA